MPKASHTSQYNEQFIAALQWMWGDGYLSPGGPEEVEELLAPVDLRNKTVLDIGCGLGAITVLLANKYEARGVLGIDVESHLIEHCRKYAHDAGLDDKVSFDLVEPGPLPYSDNSFDVVFTKDSIIHMPDKYLLYCDIFRILKPAGVFVGSDWLRGGDETYSGQAARWLELVHLDFTMKSIGETRLDLESAGFENIHMTDRNAWYREAIKIELATLSGDRLAELAKRIGQKGANHRLQSSTLKQQVLKDGFLRPTHFAGYKPR